MNPAEELEGLTVDDGWVIVERLIPSSTSTGGNFSVGYVVRHPQHGEAFLKALDYSRAFRAQDSARVLQSMTTAFVFEREVLGICGQKHLDRVVRALAAGQVDVPGGAYPVNYLIFERADGDVRGHLDTAPEFDTAWVLRVLHNVAVGLRQLHGEQIAHQDLKPSNALIFDGKECKVADLGCADMRGADSPRGEHDIAGDPVYAPPELLYGEVSPDWRARRQATDLYHLGSLILFLFTGIATTPALFHYLLIEQYPGNWHDPYEDALPYLRSALDEVASDLEGTLEGWHAADLVTMFRELCDPDPRLRGHPQTRAGNGDPFALERYVTKLDLLAQRAASAVTLRGTGP